MNLHYLKEVLGISELIYSPPVRPVILSLLPLESRSSLKDKGTWELTQKIFAAVGIQLNQWELLEIKENADILDMVEGRPSALIFCHSQLRSRIRLAENNQIKICPHPLEMLINPELKKEAWAKLKSWSPALS